MLVDLVNLTTSDDIRLDGAFFAPESGFDQKGPIDAVLILHGSQGNFYEASNTTMAGALTLNRLLFQNW